VFSQPQDISIYKNRNIAFANPTVFVLKICIPLEAVKSLENFQKEIQKTTNKAMKKQKAHLFGH